MYLYMSLLRPQHILQDQHYDQSQSLPSAKLCHRKVTKNLPVFFVKKMTHDEPFQTNYIIIYIIFIYFLFLLAGCKTVVPPCFRIAFAPALKGSSTMRCGEIWAAYKHLHIHHGDLRPKCQI